MNLKCLLDEVSFILSKKLLQHQYTVMFKYGIFDFLYLHQVVTSLARTGILFQNNVNILKLLVIILSSMFDSNFLHPLVVFHYLPKLKLVSALIYHQMIALQRLWKFFLFHLKSSFYS